jgi:hypothetical protein
MANITNTASQLVQRETIVGATLPRSDCRVSLPSRFALRLQGVAPIGAWVREVPLPDCPEDGGQEVELPTH